MNLHEIPAFTQNLTSKMSGGPIKKEGSSPALVSELNEQGRYSGKDNSKSFDSNKLLGKFELKLPDESGIAGFLSSRQSMLTLSASGFPNGFRGNTPSVWCVAHCIGAYWLAQDLTTFWWICIIS